MLTISIQLSNIELNKGQYTKALFDTLDTQNRQAARAWLRAVLLRVPVFTGQARGSLKPLGQFLKVAVPINPVAHRSGYGPEYGASQSSFEFTRGYITEFVFNEAVIHYLINEFYDVNPPIHLTHSPRPWASFEQGKLAYRAYLKQYLKEKLPQISKYMLRGIIKGRSK